MIASHIGASQKRIMSFYDPAAISTRDLGNASTHSLDIVVVLGMSHRREGACVTKSHIIPMASEIFLGQIILIRYALASLLEEKHG